MTPTVLEEGQAVKIDLGAHVDGYVSTVAHTVVLMGDMNAPVTGAQADVMKAVVTAGEAAIRKLRPGVANSEVAKAIERVAEDFGVRVVEGVLSHNMKRYVIDGNKVILNKPSAELKADEADIALNEVYALDIVMSSGEGTPKMIDEKETAVYKRAVENNYKLKMQASRAVFSEIPEEVPHHALLHARHGGHQGRQARARRVLHPRAPAQVSRALREARRRRRALQGDGAGVAER
jgi:methionyl aminopeptidase